LQDAATAIVYAIAIMVVMHFVYEEPITAVLATSGAAAFIIGFSAQSTIKEVFAGLSLSATKALHIGDYLEIDGIYGRVHEINWRSISLHNPHTDSLYIFPNSAVAEKIILNYNEPTGRFKNWVKFTVEPGASPELVTRAVLDSLKHSRYVVRDPAPDMNILGFNDLGIEFRIRYFFDGDDPWWDAQNEVVSAIWSALRRHGVHLAVKRFQLQTGDELAESFWPVRKELDQQEIHSWLQRSSALAALGEDELRALAKEAVCRDFEPPDCIYFEGDNAGTLYLIADGEVTATCTSDRGTEADVAVWQAGDVFGVTGLATGDAHGETAQATRYCTVYQIDPFIVRQILEKNGEWKADLEAASHAKLEDYQSKVSDALHRDRNREHERQKAHLNRLLRDHIRATFGKGLVSSIASAISPTSSERRTLKAIMAASALVAQAGGKNDHAARSNVVKSLESLHLLKHVDHGQCLDSFDEFASALNKAEGRDTALDAIRDIRGNDKIAHIIVGICHGIHGPAGKIEDAEHEEIAKIAGILDVSANPDEIVATIGAGTAQ
jgi:CRP-like cAMP-binding protein